MFSAVSLWNRLPAEFNFLIDYCVFSSIILFYSIIIFFLGQCINYREILNATLNKNVLLFLLLLLLLLLLGYELHRLPLKQRTHFKILLFAFKATHGIEPTYIQNLVSWKPQGVYNLRSSGRIFLASPTLRTKVTLSDQSINQSFILTRYVKELKTRWKYDLILPNRDIHEDTEKQYAR